MIAKLYDISNHIYFAGTNCPKTVNGGTVRLIALHTFIIDAHPCLISHVTAIRRLSARLYEARHTKAPFSRYTRSSCHRKFPCITFRLLY